MFCKKTNGSNETHFFYHWWTEAAVLALGAKKCMQPSPVPKFGDVVKDFTPVDHMFQQANLFAV